jgi:malate dehydrogenase (oxaloacetate-decarboxylating)
MLVKASEAIASLVTDEELSRDYVIPRAFDKRVHGAVAEAVKQAAIETKVARKK